MIAFGTEELATSLFFGGVVGAATGAFENMSVGENIVRNLPALQQMGVTALYLWGVAGATYMGQKSLDKVITGTKMDETMATQAMVYSTLNLLDPVSLFPSEFTDFMIGYGYNTVIAPRF